MTSSSLDNGEATRQHSRIQPAQRDVLADERASRDHRLLRAALQQRGGRDGHGDVAGADRGRRAAVDREGPGPWSHV